MSIRKLLLTATVLAPLLTGASWAGPYSEGEARLTEAYGDYRAALFQTNQKNKEATEASLSAFRAKWKALSDAWRTAPPPQYSEDPCLNETLDEVSRSGDEAAKLASSGDLARSHDALEKIRDAIGTLRGRNGILSFSDRMNAYHEEMEHLLEAKDPSPGDVAERAAVLAYLAKALRENRPQNVEAAAFEAAIKPLEASVEQLRSAARAGDRAAVDAARKALKPPYSRLFLRFG